jgi:hypothetical protein
MHCAQRADGVFFPHKGSPGKENIRRKNRMRDWKQWLRCAAVRGLKTVAQTAIATIGTSAVMGQVNWGMVASAAALAGILSMLTSVAGLPECSGEGAGE